MPHPINAAILTWIVTAQSSVDIIDAEKDCKEGVATVLIGYAIFASKIRQELIVNLSREGVVDRLIWRDKGAVYNSSRVSKVVEIDQAVVVLGGYVLRPIESIS